MLLFFGTPWNDVDVATVESFLAEAGDEGLFWEAKGHSQPHRDAVRKAVCGLANAEGGFFIIGAQRDEKGAWQLPGVPFTTEPGTWLSSVIDSGLSPRPWFDVKSFERSEGRVAAVVAVESVAVPPCVTATGVVYQRVTGQTLPVTDQRVLAELFARGRAVREQAEGLAMRAAARALAEPAAQSPDEAILSVALCPTQTAEDKSAVLFSENFAGRVSELITNGLQVIGQGISPVRVEPRQDCLYGYPGSRETESSWTAAAYWDGSVSAVFTMPGSELYPSDLIPCVKQAWRAIVQIALAAGGGGDAHLVVHVRCEHPAVSSLRRGHPSHPVRRWTVLQEPTDDEFESVQRELQRGFGERVWEPKATVGA